MLAAVSLLLVILARASEAGLYETYYGSNHIYSFYAGGSDNTDWNQADFKCSFNNHEGLVMIKYSYMGPEVKELMDAWGSRETYIGMHDKYTEGYWYYRDGTKVYDYSYRNWASGEPNDHRGEDCGSIKTPANTWNDNDCGHSYGFICEQSKTRMNPLSSTEFIIGDFEDAQGSLVKARDLCRAQGFRLAVVDSDDKIDLMKRNPMWDDSTSYWIDGAKNCLNSDDCVGKRNFICEAVHSFDMKLSSRVNDYMEGDAIEVECSAFGLPTPNVTWHKYIGSMTDDSSQNAYQIMEPGKSTLVIKSATLEDTSRYRCFSANEINGESRRTKTSLDIRVHPPTLTRKVEE